MTHTLVGLLPIKPENTITVSPFVFVVALGEGLQSWHRASAKDYATLELDLYQQLNFIEPYIYAVRRNMIGVRVIIRERKGMIEAGLQRRAYTLLHAGGACSRRCYGARPRRGTRVLRSPRTRKQSWPTTSLTQSSSSACTMTGVKLHSRRAAGCARTCAMSIKRASRRIKSTTSFAAVSDRSTTSARGFP